MGIWERLCATWQGWFPAAATKDSGVPTKGRWLNSDDPHVKEVHLKYEQERAEEERREQLSRKTLSVLLQEFQGNLAAALEAKMLTDGESAGQLEVIADGMMRGNLDDSEFGLLQQLPKLRRIYLRDLAITDNGLAVLAQMPQVEELLLTSDSNKPGLTDACFRHIGRLPRLRQLHLDQMRVTGAGLAMIREPDWLSDLSIENSPVSAEGLKNLSRFPVLRRLGLWGSTVTDEALESVGQCQSLREIDLYSTPITDKGIKHLTTLGSLEELRLTDTRVTDGCLPSLLKMRCLKRVVFGDGIAVATIEALKSNGIQVDHGRVVGLHREMNVLRYAGTDYEVDSAQSALQAYIRAEGAQNVTWRLEIQCTDAYVPENTQPAQLEGPPMDFGTASWRELAGREFRVKYDEASVHPILPDNPCNIYIGYHACPNNHHISIRERRGNRFLIEWTCEAKECEEFPGEPVYVLAEIPFTEVIVWSDDQIVGVAQATALLESQFNPDDFAAPEVQEQSYGSQIRFPVKAKE